MLDIGVLLEHIDDKTLKFPAERSNSVFIPEHVIYLITNIPT